MNKHSKRRVAIIGTAGVPAKYGGFETLADNLCEHLNADDLEIVVYCSKFSDPSKPRSYCKAKLVYIPLKPNGWQSLAYDFCSIFHSIFWGAETLLLLGVSGSFALPFVRLFPHVKVVTNVDGVESRRAKWGKVAKLVLKLLEWFAIRFSHVVIADNEGIREYLSKSYKIQPSVIAYGGDHLSVEPNQSDALNKFNYALCLGRIEPENNTHMILEAFSEPFKASSLKLIAIGNWEDSNYGRSLKNKYKLNKNIEIIDPVYDRQIVSQYRTQASVYIHGHSAGGTNPSLVEAMFFPVPVLCYDCNFNRYTTDGMATYFKDASDLRSAVELLLLGEHHKITYRLLEYANANYRWAEIARKYQIVLTAESSLTRE
jgi:glycosyltransferase involved in cell wall biosynthesis